MERSGAFGGAHLSYGYCSFLCVAIRQGKGYGKSYFEKNEAEAEECQWLREFAPVIRRPDKEGMSITWDWLPQDWTMDADFYDKQAWMEHAVMKGGNVAEEYTWVVDSLDQLLERHGYVREGNYYRVLHSNMDTIAFFAILDWNVCC